jgi:hypothetical protein
MATNPASAPNRSLQFVYASMAILQVVLVCEFIFDSSTFGMVNDLFQLIDEQRSGLLLAELFALGVLFVDAVVRFDQLQRRWAHCIGIAFFACHWMFQMFVHFLSSSYLN